MRKLNKKVAAGVAAAAIVAVGAGTAYAYWTTTGSGTGSAANGTSNGTIVLHASFADGLTPGAITPVTYTADNANSSSLYVGTVTPTVSIDTAHATAGCSAADFVVSALAANKTVPAHATGYALGSNDLAFTDTSANQDACKGATVTLTLASN
jgi:hypothetical protein